jgi:DNA-binding MarR family transcriptional regulator
LEPLLGSERPRARVDPAAIQINNTVSVTIDITQLLQNQAGHHTALDLRRLDSLGGLAGSPGIAPLLGVISRSLDSALGILELTHFRVLVLLSDKDSLIVAELMGLMKMRSRPLLNLLDAMAATGWIFTKTPGRGVTESIAITEQGRALVDRVTQQRQHEIDNILERMSEQDRAVLANAFNSFVEAAGEPTVRNPNKGLAP